jgi:hypothetical protein
MFIPKRRLTFSGLHGVIYQKMVPFLLGSIFNMPYFRYSYAGGYFIYTYTVLFFNKVDYTMYNAGHIDSMNECIVTNKVQVW